MSRYLKIGLFVTVTATLLVAYVMRTANTVGGGGGSYTVHAYMEDASGLVIDSAVRLAGVQVGRLTDIQLDENRARLTMELQGMSRSPRTRSFPNRRQVCSEPPRWR